MMAAGSATNQVANNTRQSRKSDSVQSPLYETLMERVASNDAPKAPLVFHLCARG
jgi:hypothetical protein